VRTRLKLAALVLAPAILGQGQLARQQQQQRIDVQEYAIDMRIDPSAQTLTATAKVSFIPLDDASTVSFELNNALSLDKVTDDQGHQIPASRTQQDMSVRLSLPQAVSKGKLSSLTFYYDGKLTGEEESPVFGIKFAAIHPDVAYLMYPARWFPVNDYTTDRFSSDLKVTVPTGYRVLAGGTNSNEPAPDGMTSTRFQFKQASFPGSLAVVRGEPRAVTSGGVTTNFYFRETSGMADAYGQEFARAMEYLTSLYGTPAQRNLAVVETEAGTPNGYSAPGVIFLAPRAIGKEVNLKLVANNVSRQWWGAMVSPATRNHMWIENGLARYSELLYVEHINGPGALEQEVHDTYITALTVDQPPLIQSSRLEDYSPEFWAATAGKGAAVLHMLRGVIGDEQFFKVLNAIPQRFAWKSISTDELRKLTEEITGQNLNYFFLQWIESSGAPEFNLTSTTLRVTSASNPNKGFEVRGKITQDLDLFQMPVQVHVETEGNPEDKTVQVVGTSSEFSVDTFGKPRPGGVTVDPKGLVLHWDSATRVAVAIRRGEQFVDSGDFAEALKEYQKALDVNRQSSLAHYRIAEVFFLQGNFQSSLNSYRSALDGDLTPKWTEVWSHIKMGWIYDVIGGSSRERAVDQYKQALRTKDDTQGALEEAQKGIEHPYERTKASN
jgi:tetratricopeptide (TPR) repeat protein